MEHDFGQLLRRYRLAAGFTQENLAARARLSSQAVGSLERGDRRRPYRHTVTALAEALGLDEAEQARLLAAARPPGRPRSRPRPRQPSTASPAVVAPRQLPAAPPHFTGRDTELTTLTRALDRTGDTPAADAARPSRTGEVIVAAIHGMGGVGKTALALRTAHAVAGHYPDGQVYLDLRGTADPLDTRAAMTQLLGSIAGPSGTGEGVDTPGAYRSVLAGRRVLLVLDNASGPEQVADLLPGTVGCAAIVTSRNSLDRLPVTVHLRLDTLPEPEAHRLLTTVIGPQRLAAEPEATARVVRHCAGLPLALRLAASRLAARPQWPIAHLADRLAEPPRRLDTLERQDLGVRSCFAASIDLLDTEARGGFAALGVLSGGDFSIELVARLLDVSEAVAERLLERFTDLALLDATGPGMYRVHDLLHVYARELSERLLNPDRRAAAVERCADLLVGVAWHSLRLAQPDGTRATWGTDVGTGPRFPGTAEAFAWLDAHRPRLVEIATATATPPRQTVQLSLGLFAYYLSRGHLMDWSAVTEAAATAAAESPHDALRAAATKMDHGMARCDLAAAWGGDPTEGVDLMYHGLKEFRELGDDAAIAACLINMAATFIRIGRLDAARDCAEESLALCDEVLDSRAGQAAAAFNLGTVFGELGDRDRQLAHYRRSLDLIDPGNDLGRAEVLRGIGTALRHHREPDAAADALRRAAALSRSVGDLAGRATALEELGTILAETGETASAAQARRESLAVAAELGDVVRADRLRRLLA